MLKIILLACFLCLACLPVQAQSTDTTKVQIIDAKNVHQYFGKYVQEYTDKSNLLTLEDVKKKPFSPSQKNGKYKVYDHEINHWFKWVISSDLSYDTEKILFLGNISTAEITIAYKNGNTITKQTGANIPASQRDMRLIGGGFKIFLPKGEKITLWIKVRHLYYPRLVIFKFEDVLPIVLSISKSNFQGALIHGGLWMIFLYNLILLLINRDRIYLYYLGYLFVSNSLILFTSIAHYFYVGEYLAYEAHIFFGLLGNIAIWYMAFIRDFLETRQIMPHLDKWALLYLRFRVGWIILILALFTIDVISYAVCSWIVSTTVVFDIILGAGVAIQQGKQENRDVNKYLSWGSYCLFIGGGLATLLPLANIKTNIQILGWSFNYFEIGLYAQIIIFSIGLSVRSKKMEKERRLAQERLITELEKNEKLIKEQNSILEEKVQERTHKLQQTNEELNITLELIETERQKSDKLLLNILPVETAYELKEKGFATPKHYNLITVLFTDFKGFTHIVEKMSPHEVIENLNTCFYALDVICDKYGLEKIKTIGDSYMCAGGLPIANTTNPIDVVKAGLEMQVFMMRWKAEKEAIGKPAWELRLGIHSGEAVAGVVGKNKFAYDIWGDTVNLASRMESSGEVGKVNISGATYELVKDAFVCTYRGAVIAKNKGEVEMYFVEKIL